MAIKEFRDQYLFLSNFYAVPVEYNGITFPTAEHAFQYQKVKPNTDTTDYWQEQILNSATASQAKTAGAHCPIVKNWNDDRIEIMRNVVKAKFDQHPELKQRLIDTGDEKLVEGNYWNDEFWGVSLHSNKGLNHLGQILMDLRESYS